MTLPLYTYLKEPRDGHVSDETAREDITRLVNDQDLIKEVCAFFHEKTNMDSTCYAMGKVYDVQGESFGCVSIISEDVAGIIGEPLQETQEGINYALVGAYLDFRGMCDGNAEMIGAWDGFLELILSRSFLPLFENGLRARLIHSSLVGTSRLPLVVFTVYQQYDAL
jgi:hypothetical protein